MKISKRTDYGCRALLDLALHWPSVNPHPIQAVAERQGIPIKFLTQILIQLKQAGYIKSVRGKHGGYLLAMPPKDVKLKNIVQLFGSFDLTENHKFSTADCHVMDVIWQEINQVLQSQLEMIDYEILCDRVRRQSQTLTFDI
jgi:Rrf2 family protein